MMEKISVLFGKAKTLRHVWDKKSGILVGHLDDGTPISLSDKLRTGHVQVIGSTGRGKTESVILPWMLRDLRRGRSVVLIDGKGNPTLANRLKDHVEGLSGVPPLVNVFDLGNPSESIALNPLANGSAQEITDRIFSAFEFQDPFYRAVQYEIAGAVISLMKESGGVVTFSGLYELLTDSPLLAKRLENSRQEAVKRQLSRFLTQKASEQVKNTMGLVSQLAPFAVGEIARLVNGRKTADSKFGEDVSDVLRLDNGFRAHALIILLPTLRLQKIAAALGKMLLQELAGAVGERASRGSEHAFVGVYLDEFSAFAYKGFEQILNKARSANVALHISHQSLGDLSAVSPDFAKSVNTNTNIKCILGVNDPDTADFFARHLGTETIVKTTEQAVDDNSWFGRGMERTGALSVREVESYKIHPNRLKNYTCGQGVIHVPTPDGNVTEEIHFASLGGEE